MVKVRLDIRREGKRLQAIEQVVEQAREQGRPPPKEQPLSSAEIHHMEDAQVCVVVF